MSSEHSNSASAASSPSTDVDVVDQAVKPDWRRPMISKIRMEDTALMTGSINDGEGATGPI